jgi:hypothetical protein
MDIIKYLKSEGYTEIKEMPTYTDVDLGFKNYVIEELKS